MKGNKGGLIKKLASLVTAMMPGTGTQTLLNDAPVETHRAGRKRAPVVMPGFSGHILRSEGQSANPMVACKNARKRRAARGGKPRKLSAHRAGFTLTETLVVVAIVGIMFGLAYSFIAPRPNGIITDMTSIPGAHADLYYIEIDGREYRVTLGEWQKYEPGDLYP
jgi:prepilin-type N-terminal cleavage/methylation domain-containing protein